MSAFGKQSPRYSYVLDPDQHDRFSACPRCTGPLETIEVVLLILVASTSPLMLAMPCRHCTTCDLLLVPGTSLERGWWMLSARASRNWLVQAT